jgi:hypothetical protein
MADTQKGTVGCVWACDGITMAGTAISVSIKTSMDFSQEGDMKEIKDESGDTAIVVFSDDKKKLAIELIPTGATKSAARVNNALPSRGSLVTFTADAVTAAAGIKIADLTTNPWVYTNGSIKLAQDSEARITLNLNRYTNNLTAVS